MGHAGQVSPDFEKMVNGYGLTTAQILYRMPDHQLILQTYIWQEYDVCPKFPELHGFRKFWKDKLDGPLFKVFVAHSNLIKPTEIRSVDGVLHLR